MVVLVLPLPFDLILQILDLLLGCGGVEISRCVALVDVVRCLTVAGGAGREAKRATVTLWKWELRADLGKLKQP